MNAPAPFARCFGGGQLVGHKLVRIAYLDEAGISNPAHEPYLVVAGIILHADEHWRPLEEHFRAIAQRYLPGESRPLFHAMDIFHGNRRFDRNKWPRQRREHLLAELCEIPGKFQIPVVFGFHHRQRHRDDILKQHPDVREEDIRLVTHMDTFIKASMAIEGWMHRTTRDETVMIIAEDTPQIKKQLKVLHSANTDRFATLGAGVKLFNATRIVETVHFAAKADSMPLQVADVCAFIIKRHLMEKEDAEPFFDLLRPHLAWNDEDNGTIGVADDGELTLLQGFKSIKRPSGDT